MSELKYVLYSDLCLFVPIWFSQPKPFSLVLKSKLNARYSRERIVEYQLPLMLKSVFLFAFGCMCVIEKANNTFRDSSLLPCSFSALIRQLYRQMITSSCGY